MIKLVQEFIRQEAELEVLRSQLPELSVERSDVERQKQQLKGALFTCSTSLEYYLVIGVYLQTEWMSYRTNKQYWMSISTGLELFKHETSGYVFPGLSEYTRAA